MSLAEDRNIEARDTLFLFCIFGRHSQPAWITTSSRTGVAAALHLIESMTWILKVVERSLLWGGILWESVR